MTITELDEVLYRLNRAIDSPDVEALPYKHRERLVIARDTVWDAIVALDPTRKD